MRGILCVMAHPDDEAFGCAGTAARYASQGLPVDLLTFTPGQHGSRPAPIESPEQLGMLRRHELEAAAHVMGVRELRILDYVDGRLDEAPQRELAAHVRDQIAASQPDTIITFGPLGITRHADHIGTHRAVIEAVRSLADPPRVFYMAVTGDWADELQLQGPEAEPTHQIDITAFAGVKLTALACHSSQEDAREFFLRLAKRSPRHELFHQALPQVEEGCTRQDLFES